MDSIGNIPIFVAVLKEIHPRRQRLIIIRELCIALAIMILFFFVGDLVLNLLGIQQSAVMIAGGIILFLIAIRMIFPVKKDLEKGAIDEEPFIVPLAVPLIAGPAVLAAIMIYSGQEKDLLVLSAIIIAWFISTVVLLSASFLKKILGKRGMIACERLMGLILTLIAIEMFLNGINSFCKYNGYVQ